MSVGSRCNYAVTLDLVLVLLRAVVKPKLKPNPKFETS